MKRKQVIKDKLEELMEDPGPLWEPREDGQFPEILHDEPHESAEHTRAIEILRWVLENKE